MAKPKRGKRNRSATMDELRASPFISVWCKSSGLEHRIRKTAITRWVAHTNKDFDDRENPGGTRVFIGAAWSMVITEDFEVFTKLMETLS